MFWEAENTWPFYTTGQHSIHRNHQKLTKGVLSLSPGQEQAMQHHKPRWLAAIVTYIVGLNLCSEPENERLKQSMVDVLVVILLTLGWQWEKGKEIGSYHTCVISPLSLSFSSPPIFLLLTFSLISPNFWASMPITTAADSLNASIHKFPVESDTFICTTQHKKMNAAKEEGCQPLYSSKYNTVSPLVITKACVPLKHFGSFLQQF